MGDHSSYRNMGFGGNDARTLAWTREVNAQNARNARQRQAARGREAQSRRTAGGGAVSAGSSGFSDFIGGVLVFGLLALVILSLVISAGVFVYGVTTNIIVPWLLANWFVVAGLFIGYGILPYAVHRRAKTAKADYLLPELMMLGGAMSVYFCLSISVLDFGFKLIVPHLSAFLIAWIIPTIVFWKPHHFGRARGKYSDIANTNRYWAFKTTLFVSSGAGLLWFVLMLIFDVVWDGNLPDLVLYPMGIIVFNAPLLVFALLLGLIAFKTALFELYVQLAGRAFDLLAPTKRPTENVAEI